MKALITGANKGIGKQIAKELGLRGYDILLGARNENRGAEAVAELRSAGVKNIEFIPIDLNDFKTLHAAGEWIREKHPDLSLLVNNAGIPGDMRKPADEFSTDELRQTMEVNFFGNHELIHTLLPILRQNAGRIVNISIPIGRSFFFNPFAYKTSKAALNAMTVALGVQFEKEKSPMQIFAIMPGGVTTDLNGNSRGNGMKTPEEAGKLIVDFILDGKNHNGQIINWDGTLSEYDAGLAVSGRVGKTV